MTATSVNATTVGEANNVRPWTGAEYIESLRDGREIYYKGERVKDVTTHPAFRNSVRSVARMYDALHDPAKKDVLTARRLHSPVLQDCSQCRRSGAVARRDRGLATGGLRLDGAFAGL